jgi:hypothetical protein
MLLVYQDCSLNFGLPFHASICFWSITRPNGTLIIWHQCSIIHHSWKPKYILPVTLSIRSHTHPKQTTVKSENIIVFFMYLIYIRTLCHASFNIYIWRGAVVAVILWYCWIYNYLCNQCLSPLMLWVRISIRARCTILFDKVCQSLATGLWFSLGPPVSSTNKTDHHDITEILLKVVLNTIKQTNKQTYIWYRIHLFFFRWIHIYDYSIECIIIK